MKFIFPPSAINKGQILAKKMTRKRQACLNKWGHKCVYCDIDLVVETMTFDHLVPKSKGGGKGLDNLVPSCQMCNTLRGNFESLQEFDDVVARTRPIIAVAEQIRNGKKKPFATI